MSHSKIGVSLVPLTIYHTKIYRQLALLCMKGKKNYVCCKSPPFASIKHWTQRSVFCNFDASPYHVNDQIT